MQSSPIRITAVLDYFKESRYIDWVLKVGRREANRVSKQAMKVGTEVDKHIKYGSYHAVVSKDGSVINCLSAFNKWFDVYTPKTIENGTRLFANIGGVDVTGEPDIIVDSDTLVDIKCSTKISPKYWIQVNMYNYLSGSIYKKLAILRLDKKTGSYEYVVKDPDKCLVDVWVGMLRAMLYLQGEEDDGNNL